MFKNYFSRSLICKSAQLSISILWLSFASPLFSIDLVRDGKPSAVIVVPDKALPCVTMAAEELVYHLHLSSGAKLRIVKEHDAPKEGSLIFVGKCRASVSAGIDVTTLPANGFVLKTIGDQFFLLGDDSDGIPAWILHSNRTRVGSLFAVYEFLEKYLKVRWLWPGKTGEVIPRQRDITSGDLDQKGKPALIHTRWRDGGRLLAGTEGWAKQATRSLFLSEQGKWLRRNRFAMSVNMNMAHAFTNWWERYHEEHPEFFNLLPDGKRRSDPNYHGGPPSLISMCVSNPELHREIVKQWKKTRSPEHPFLDASENDTDGRCTCPNCLGWDIPNEKAGQPWSDRLVQAKKAFDAGDKKWTAALGPLSDRYARFFLALQKEAHKIDPEAVVMGYAYANYVDPPLNLKLNEKVMIGFVPHMYFPWTDEIRNDNRVRWDEWRKTGARFMLRPNWMLDGHNMPMNMARKLGEDFSYYANNGMMATDFDSLTGQYSTQGPNLYMLARLHARPEMKVEEVLDEYFSAFGKADPAVRAYFGHWEKTCNDVTEKPPGLHWTFFYREAHQIFTPVSMQKGKLLLDKAILAVSENAASDSIEKQRVEFLQKGLENARLTLAAQAALLQYRNAKGISELRKTIHDLDTFRASVEADLICNMNFLASTELKTWSRELLNPAPISEKDSRPFSEKNNPVKNGGMEREPGDWKKSVMHGRFTFSQDKTTAHSGKSSLKLQCLEMLDEKAAKKHRTRSWARWYQRGIPVEKGKACRLRLWVKTSKDFSGRVSIFVTGDAKKGTVLVESLSTGGRWMELLSPEIVPKENTLDVYLNLQDSGGTAWFDDVRLEVMAQP